jgi:hypothetical protein
LSALVQPDLEQDSLRAHESCQADRLDLIKTCFITGHSKANLEKSQVSPDLMPQEALQRRA